MADRYDVCVPREGKEGKTYWTKIGTAWPSKQGDGLNIVLEALPLGAKMSCFPVKDRDAKPQPKQQADTFNDDNVPY
jgi:hypothetical protein